MEAFQRGEEIECAGYDTSWHYVETPSWNWKENDYRIKPKPKQVVVIEKWLVTDGKYFNVIESSDIDEYIKGDKWVKWVKVARVNLNTYEVEL